jgi:hypothetical protein
MNCFDYLGYWGEMLIACRVERLYQFKRIIVLNRDIPLPNLVAIVAAVIISDRIPKN